MVEHPQARFIVEKLASAGFVAYYAGGWVRDLLLKHPSDDIDIATNAPPEAVQALFPHTVPVGIAFGIILVIIDERKYEVATFRQDADYRDGRRPSRIEFATEAEDAQRRDFTINGMFYDPLRNQILDYVGGRTDLEARIIRAIGNPHERIGEDRLRMIRAIRLSCRFGFRIEETTEDAIRAHAEELFPAVAIERVWQELTKGRDFGKLPPMLAKLHEYSLLQVIFPELKMVSLKEIEERLFSSNSYPIQTPVIAFILPLFPDLSLEEGVALCRRFKLSKKEVSFLSFLHEARPLLQGKKEREELSDWAHFYANPSSSLALQIVSADLDPLEKERFLKKHGERILFLDRSIQRIRNRTPLLKGDDLAASGIEPGAAMGLLLKEGERIAINEQIQDPFLLLERLKKSPLWPHTIRKK